MGLQKKEPVLHSVLHSAAKAAGAGADLGCFLNRYKVYRFPEVGSTLPKSKVSGDNTPEVREEAASTASRLL